MSKAVFLDRDGTLVRPTHFPSSPNQIQVLDGLAVHLRALQDAGWRLIVITNQSGIARGYFDEAALVRMHGRLRAQLSAWRVTLDGIYHCPHHQEGIVTEFAIDCDCRKPQPGMLLRAADDFNVELTGSWMIGDILDDVEAGNRAGCRTVLADLGTEQAPGDPLRRPDYVARDAAHALTIVRSVEGHGPAVELSYRPETWVRIPASASGRDEVNVGRG